MRDIRNIVILTGAGISAESGLATFRGPDGLWEGHRVEDVARPRPSRAIRRWSSAFYDARRAKLADGRAQCGAPGAGAARRRMAGRAADRHPECRRSARARRGEAAAAHARRAQVRLVPRLRRAHAWESEMGDGPACPACGAAGRLRPDIVWFGEMPYEMERIDRALMDARPVRLDRHLGRRLSRRRLRPDRALCRRADAGDEPGAEPRQLSVRRKPDGQGGGAGAGMGGGDAE